MELPKLNYKVSTKRGSIEWVDSEEFSKRFTTAGHNFKTRLEQLKTFIPDAVDWELEEQE